ncbi:MAG: glycosyltransferase family 2 protein [Oscillospiraceae bacterium]|nr:glycosyltransferase family 2 protein [Oscillospiraceae bacterium]
MEPCLISVVVPCYNEEAALPLFLEALRETASSLRTEFDCATELVFVDDGSRDGTLPALREAARTDSHVHYLSFSRNFGKEAAMYAGLEYARGDYIVIMDADLQHPPSMLREMVSVLNSGEYDCAAARRVSRTGEPRLRSFFSRRFYRLINRISDTEIVEGACDFRMMSRRMVDAILSLREYNRFSKGIFSWVGFRTKWLPFENQERVAGETKWSFWGLLVYAVQGIVGFSTAPLVFVALLGVLLCVGALLMVVYVIVKTLLFGDPVGGWPSMACMVMFLGGVQLFCMGILGEYLAKTYLEVKRRPIYVLSETDEDAD